MRTVRPSATSSIDSAGARSSAGGKDFWIRSVPRSLPPTGGKGWNHFGLFRATTPILTRLECHFSHLAPGASPHPPHRHEEEEIMIPLGGGLDLILGDGPGEGPLVEPGRMIFLPSEISHSHRAVGAEGAVYLVFKWRGNGTRECTAGAGPVLLEAGSASVGSGAPTPSGVEMGGFAEVACRGIEKLKVHHTRLVGGAGPARHSDPYDVALILLGGGIETLLGPVTAPAVLFHRAGVDHWRRQIGPVPATYMVLEFHG